MTKLFGKLMYRQKDLICLFVCNIIEIFKVYIYMLFGFYRMGELYYVFKKTDKN